MWCTGCAPLQADVVRLCEDENDTQPRAEKFLYVLMYVCLFTRRVWLRALRSKSAIGVAREVSTLGVIARVGCSAGHGGLLSVLNCKSGPSFALLMLGTEPRCCGSDGNGSSTTGELLPISPGLPCLELLMHGAPPHRPLQIYFLWMDTMVPGKLQTDNGSEFANAILNELCDLFGVEFIHGSVGHPQSQARTAPRQCSVPTVASHASRTLPCCHAASACLRLK